jgi:hypothetical protein
MGDQNLLSRAPSCIVDIKLVVKIIAESQYDENMFEMKTKHKPHTNIQSNALTNMSEL